MTQDDCWLTRYNEVMEFMVENKLRIEELKMLNWIKHYRKMMNAGKMKEERVEMIRRLLEVGEKYKHVNQYA